MRDYDCLSDKDYCAGVESGVALVEPWAAACPYGRQMEAGVGRVSPPIFAPRFEAAIVLVGEASPVHGWRDS